MNVLPSSGLKNKPNKCEESGGSRFILLVFDPED
jgi:hypothetical protein